MNGERLLDAMMSLRRFHEQVGLLLQTSDALLAEEGFNVHPKVGRTAVAYYSYVVDTPMQWTPEFAFRWYAVPGSEALAAFVSVILCPREAVPGVPKFEEPLVSCGVARFYDGVPAGTALYHFARAILWTNVPRDGTWAVHKPSAPRHGRIDIDVRAVPLADVVSTEALHATAIVPLLEKISNTTHENDTPA